MIAQLFILASAQFSGRPHIPGGALDTPGSIRGAPETHKIDWDWASVSALSGENGILDRLRNAGMPQSEGQEIDLEKQSQYIATINTLSDEIEQEAAQVAKEREEQQANEQSLVDEGNLLVDAHNQEEQQASLYNAAASVSNAMLVSGSAWEMSLGQAQAVESLINGQEDNRGSTVAAGQEIIAAAERQLEELDRDVESKVSQLREGCVKTAFEWNMKATTECNEGTWGVADLLDRTKLIKTQLTLAHDECVQLLKFMGTSLLEVNSTSSTASLLQERAKEVLSIPVVKDKKGLINAEASGFWKKLSVMKDMFEHHFQEDIGTPMHLIAQKFHDA